MTKNQIGQTATVTDNQLRINMAIDDPYLVEHFGSMEMAGTDLTVVIPNYLRLYTKIVDDASPRATELTVAKSIGNLEVKVDSTIGNLVESVGSATEEIDKLLKKSLGEFGETPQAVRKFQNDLLAYIDNEGSPFHRLIATKVSQSVTQAMELSKLTTDSITSAIEKHSEPRRAAEHKEVLEVMNRIYAEVNTAKRVTEALQGTPKKGYPYEDMAFDALAEVASGSADLCENTSNVAGLIGRNSGDFVVTHTVEGNPRFNLVYEAKSGKDMNKAKWLNEADLALPNRDAKVFVGLSKELDSVPGKTGFTMLRDNVLIMHFDPESNPADIEILKVVYRYALSIGRNNSGQKSSRLNEAASELRAAIDDLKKRHSQAKIVEKNGLELKLFVEEMAKRLPAILSMLEETEDSELGGDA